MTGIVTDDAADAFWAYYLEVAKKVKRVSITIPSPVYPLCYNLSRSVRRFLLTLVAGLVSTDRYAWRPVVSSL